VNRLADLLADPGPDPEAQLLAKERMQRVAAAVTLLPTADQALLVQHFGLGDEPPVPVAELARVRKVRKAVVEAQLAAIIVALRKELE
jgi:hypothetical protein